MKNKIFIYIILLFLSSCHHDIKKYADDIEIEQSIYTIKNSRYSYLTNYLIKKPIKILFNPDSAVDCPVINLEKKQLLVPRKNYKNHILIATYVAKSLYEYKIKNEYNITSEVPFELKLLSSYLEMEFIINHLSDELIDEIQKTTLAKKLCSYIMDEESFEKMIKDEEYISDKRCFRPSLELNYYLTTIKRLRESLNDVHSEGFFRILHEMEIEKAKRGDETFYDAYRNYYYETSKPEMELYRDIRKDIFLRLKSFKSLNRFYNSEIKRFRKSRILSKELLQNFSFCGKIK